MSESKVRLIKTTDELNAFCASLAAEPVVMVDTEFLRDKTYWPQLCLVQIAGESEEACIDPLADGIVLDALHALMANPDVLKVFHAARQDLEIFFHATGRVPAPIFDTQVAAMVCGFGDSVGYETLVNKLAKASLDKGSRFTDWARRPLTDRQLAYAIGDVTHLRVVYKKLRAQLEESGRGHWLDEEMEVLTSPETYRLEPKEAWKRIKTRTDKPKFLAIVRELATWREEIAQSRDMPRNRIIRDDGILELAAAPPASLEEMARSRSISKGFAEGKYGKPLLEAIQRGINCPPEDMPRPVKRPQLPHGIGPTMELLKVLLKARAEDAGVAARLIGSTGDLEALACLSEKEAETSDLPILRGWRREVFGGDAMALKSGKMALAVAKNSVKTVPIK